MLSILRFKREGGQHPMKRPCLLGCCCRASRGLVDADGLSRMGVCAFAPFGWRLHGGVASVLQVGGLSAVVPWAGWRGLRDARFQPEVATGKACPSFGREVRLAGGFLQAGGCNEGASFLWAGGRAGCCQEAGGGLPGSALPVVPFGWDGRFILAEGRASAAVTGQPRSRTEGRRDGPSCRRLQQGCRAGRRTEARSGDIGAGGTALDLALAREALRNPTPSNRRHQRGCSSFHGNAFAGGAVCIELGSLCLFCQTGLRLRGHCAAGVAVDGGYAAGWWWRRIGGGAAVWSRLVGCGKGCPG